MPTLLETIASYVPTRIVRRYAADPAPPAAPTAEHAPAAVLFADISGFTALTERLTHSGPAGVEELSGLLNAYFGQLIALITALGGDVVKFAGDALLAIWPATEEDLATSVRRAAQCALSAQMLLHNYTTVQGIHLALRMGIGAGTVMTEQIGGVYGRWECLVTGPPLVQVGIAAGLAAPGEVVLEPEAWALVRDVCAGTPILDDKITRWQDDKVTDTAYQTLSPPHPITPSPRQAVRLDDVLTPLPLRPVVMPRLAPEMDAALRAYIPGAILARLRAGQSDWLAELRRITVLFINLPDITFTAPPEQAHKAMCALQTALYRYEGSINKLSVDDKGVTLVAALGLPPLAHEDDAVRGVQAALAMLATLGSLGLRGAIGVTTGRAFCGTVGSAVRREYTMIGTIVNLAARLMQAAGDLASPTAGARRMILCDQATYQAARAQIAFEPQPPIMVKGVVTPIPVYCPLGLGPAAARPQTALVGRAAEQIALEHHTQALLRGGAGGVVLVEGEAGIGKSRLVADFIARARGAGMFTLLGAGAALERTSAYHAWRPVLTQLLRLDSADDPAQQRAIVLAQLAVAPDLLRLAPLLNGILPIDLPENDITTSLGSAPRAGQMRDLVIRLIQATARLVPVVLVLEDAQWLDSASWALALAVSRQVRPLLLVVATRPLEHPAAPEYRQLLDAPGAQHLRLDSLDPADNVALVCQRLGVSMLPEPITALILEKAQGNPFFSEELAYALRELGVIEVADGVCRLLPGTGDLRALNLPDTVQGVITSRIDRLTPPQQLVLKVASVIGRAFAFRLLRDIYPVAEDKAGLADTLAALRQLDLIVLDAPEPQPVYLFKHLITQEVAYNLMLFAQRRGLHRAIAEWYERGYADDLSPWYPILAHHWGQASGGTVADHAALKAITYLEQAGKQALQNSASTEALALFDQALALLDHLLAEDGGWRKEDGEKLSSILLPQSSAPGSLAQWRVSFSRQAGLAHWQVGEFAAAGKRFEQSLALARAIDDRQGMADALGYLGRVADDLGQFADSRRYLEEGLALARAIGDQGGLVNLLRFLGNVATSERAYAEATARYEESLALAETIGDRGGLTAALNNLGVVAMSQHDYAGARAHFEESLTIAHTLNDKWRIALNLGNLGYVAYWLGEQIEARSRLQEGLALAKQIGNKWLIAVTLSHLGLVTCALHDDQASSRSFVEALTLAMDIGSAPWALNALAGLARLWAGQGRAEQAAELLGLALHHPASDNNVKEIAEPLLAELQATLPPALIQAALARGRARELAQTVAEVLAEKTLNS